MKVYKTVAGPRNVIVKKGDAQSGFDLFSEIINVQVRAGWEYHSMETITITEKPGCFGQPNVGYYYMLVFYKEEK